MAFLLKTRTVEPEEQPWLANGCVTRKNRLPFGSGISCAVRVDPIKRGPAAIKEEGKSRI
jgi:hypothetical protein